MKFNTLLRFGCIAILFASCEDAFEYHPYDIKLYGERNVNNHNIAKIEENCKDKDTLYVVFTGDTQGWFDQTKDMIADINSLDNIDFVVHGGDVTDYGNVKDFLWQRDLLKTLKVPFVVIIGNHDCLGNGKLTYKKIFGPTNFSFIAGRIKFVCLNTNALEYDYAEPIPDFDFLEKESNSDLDKFESTIFSMHVPPKNEQFNDNVLHAFHHYINMFPNPLFCTAAHVHSTSIREPLDDGILYYTSSCTKDRTYLYFTITKTSYHYEIRSY